MYIQKKKSLFFLYIYNTKYIIKKEKKKNKLCEKYHIYIYITPKKVTCFQKTKIFTLYYCKLNYIIYLDL